MAGGHEVAQVSLLEGDVAETEQLFQRQQEVGEVERRGGRHRGRSSGYSHCTYSCGRFLYRVTMLARMSSIEDAGTFFGSSP